MENEYRINCPLIIYRWEWDSIINCFTDRTFHVKKAKAFLGYSSELKIDKLKLNYNLDIVWRFFFNCEKQILERRQFKKKGLKVTQENLNKRNILCTATSYNSLSSTVYYFSSNSEYPLCVMVKLHTSCFFLATGWLTIHSWVQSSQSIWRDSHRV